jgi:hypothetical protein
MPLAELEPLPQRGGSKELAPAVFAPSRGLVCAAEAANDFEAALQPISVTEAKLHDEELRSIGGAY